MTTWLQGKKIVLVIYFSELRRELEQAKEHYEIRLRVKLDD